MNLKTIEDKINDYFKDFKVSKGSQEVDWESLECEN